MQRLVIIVQGLQDAIDKTARQFDDTLAAQDAAVSASPRPPTKHDDKISAKPVLPSRQTGQANGPVPILDDTYPYRRRRLWRVLLVTASAVALILAALVVFLLGGRWPPATHSPTKNPTSSPAIFGPITGAFAMTLTNPYPDIYQMSTVAFGPGGKTLAVGTQATNGISASAYLWDIATHKITATLTDPHSQGGHAVAFGPGGTTLATGDFNGSTDLWHITNHRS